VRIVRYESDRGIGFGEMLDREIRPLEGDLSDLRFARDERIPLERARLLAPVLPGKIVAVGVNYRDHAQEMGRQLPTEPLIFLKPPSAINDPEGAIEYPPQTSRLDYEGELAIVIGRKARKVSPTDAAKLILGYTCMNDVTARDLQARDVQFTRAKGFDTFAPLGPCVVTDVDPSDLAIETRLNGEVRQRSRTSQLIFKCPELVSFVSNIMTLLPGDVISTGTPAGVGPMKPGDLVEVEIERIGCLRSRVVAQQ